MRPWAYLGLRQIATATDSYEAELASRKTTEEEDKAQKILRENAAWREFTYAVKKLEKEETLDPVDVPSLKILRLRRKRFENFFVFEDGPFSLIYLRDPVERVVIPILFYHRRDKGKRIKELDEYLSKASE
jgi:hypothetical protein